MKPFLHRLSRHLPDVFHQLEKGERQRREEAGLRPKHWSLLGGGSVPGVFSAQAVRVFTGVSCSPIP